MPSRAKPQFSFIFYVGIFTFYVGIFIFYVGIFIFYVAKKKVWTFYERISNAVTRMNTDLLLLDFVNFRHCWILSHPNRLSIDNQLIINSFRRRAFTAAASLMKKAGWRLPPFPITEIKKKKKKKNSTLQIKNKKLSHLKKKQSLFTDKKQITASSANFFLRSKNIPIGSASLIGISLTNKHILKSIVLPLYRE